MQWETLGDLTEIGMAQLYTVGKKLREKYITNETLISPTYDYNNVYSRASGRDRCFMSSQSLLMGLYPVVSEDESFSEDSSEGSQGSGSVSNDLPQSFQIVPVNSVDTDRETLLRGYSVWCALHGVDSLRFILFSFIVRDRRNYIMNGKFPQKLHN